MTAEMMLLLAGGTVGFFAGRAWAEMFRARWDMKRVWSGRRGYRKRK